MAADGPRHDDEPGPGEPSGPADPSATPPSESAPDRPEDELGGTAQQPPADPWAAETELRPGVPTGAVPPSFPDARDVEPPPAAGPFGTGTPPPPVGPTGTGVLPTVSDNAPLPRWSARAQVRTPDADHGHDDQHEEWAEPGRGPITPILIGVAIVIVIGLIALATFLVFSARSTPTGPTPTASSVPSTSANSPATTPARTSSAPPSSAGPRSVPIPDVRTLDYDAAADRLRSAGFVPNRRDEVSSQLPAGKVLGTDPPANTVVLTGTKIDIIVSKGLPTPTPTITTAAPPTPTPTHT